MLFSYISYFMTSFSTRFQFYLMAIFTVIIPSLEIKSTANRKWSHWLSISFSSEICIRLDPAIREAELLTAFKHGLSKATL